MLKSLCLALCTLLLCASFSYAALQDGECDVCIKVLQDVQEIVKAEKKQNDEDYIHTAITKYCKINKDGLADRFCWYIGGLPTSATYILGMISKPMTMSVPVEKICERLKKADNAICALSYKKQAEKGAAPTEKEVPSSVKDMDLTKLPVAELKRILADWGEKCLGCQEKSEFVARIKEVRPKHEKDL